MEMCASSLGLVNYQHYTGTGTGTGMGWQHVMCSRTTAALYQLVSYCDAICILVMCLLSCVGGRLLARICCCLRLRACLRRADDFPSHRWSKLAISYRPFTSSLAQPHGPPAHWLPLLHHFFGWATRPTHPFLFGSQTLPIFPRTTKLMHADAV